VLPTGEKVHPEDLEYEINKEVGVTDSAVLGMEKEGEVKVYAVLLMKNPSEKVVPQIIKKVNQRLLPHQQIKEFSIWPYDDFPRTPTRKVKKHEVAEEIKKLRTEKPKKTSLAASSSKLELVMAQVAGLPVEKINNSQFLVKDLGLDSLGRIELVARIELHFNVSVDESQITDKTTVADIKEFVSKRKHKQVKYEFNPKIFTLAAKILRVIFQPLILLPLAWLFAPMEKKGIENIKKAEKPVLFYSNHISLADGAVIYAAFPGKLRPKVAAAAAADVLFERKTCGWRLLRFISEHIYLALPFAREGQIKTSFEHIARTLDRDYSVLVFPEGRISPDGAFQELKKGAALLAREMAVPIIPVKVAGTRAVMARSFQFPKRAPVSVVFGKPFRIEPKVADEEALKEIEKRMKEL
jgi:long-chain acyl-CoA synthetase